MASARLHDLYTKTIVPELQKKLGVSNVLAVPRISKIVLNVGAKEAVADSRVIQKISDTLTEIAGQKSVRTTARKSIAAFKIRQGMPLGSKVTLRRHRMYEFLDRLINCALPMVRDFQGVPVKFDGRGGYNLGIKEWTIFPEIGYDVGDSVYGLNITIHTTAATDDQARELLRSFGMPFRRT